MVRVTKDNIHSGKTDDGKQLVSVVVRLNYNRTKFIFLAFNPYDGGLKTVWFRDKSKKHESKVNDQDSEQAVRDTGPEPQV